ncbi:unnamed protein product, partial [Urochloa humidicola]
PTPDPLGTHPHLDPSGSAPPGDARTHAREAARHIPGGDPLPSDLHTLRHLLAVLGWMIPLVPVEVAAILVVVVVMAPACTSWISLYCLLWVLVCAVICNAEA